MAVQFGVAFSKHVIGTGVMAGGPFYCAQDSLTDALSDCMSTAVLLNVAALVQDTQSAAQQGLIDPLSNLGLFYLYSGTADYTVAPAVVQALGSQLSQLGVPAANIATQYSIASGHCVPTLNYGVTCSSTQSPFINNCQYDGVGPFLKMFYPSLAKRVSKLATVPVVAISVAPYVPSGWTPSSASLGDKFYLYVPPLCQNGTVVCSLHIALHGCEQSLNDIGTDFIQHTGYVNWAAANNLTVLFPQAVSSSGNPDSCWDWWGYTDANYAYKASVQMATIRNVAAALGAFY